MRLKLNDAEELTPAANDTSFMFTTIGGTVSGLPVATRVTLRLNNDAGSDLTIDSNRAYTFTNLLPVGEVWSVSVVSFPPGQTCLLSIGSGTVPVGGVSDANVNCSPVSINTLWDQFNWDQANWQ